MSEAAKPKPKPAMAARQVYKVIIDAPIETVWNTLVKTDEVLPFFFGSVCETKDGLKPGRKMRMVTPDRKTAAVVGEVLEFSPPHRYAHTMAFTQYEGEAPATVTYELKEVPGGTEFSLVTTNVPVGTKTEKSMAQGGPFIVLHGDGDQSYHIEPKPGLDLMRQAEHSEAREGWRLLEIPLRGNEQWQLDGDLPSTIRALSLAFDSWGGPTLRFWIDGLAFE